MISRHPKKLAEVTKILAFRTPPVLQNGGGGKFEPNHGFSVRLGRHTCHCMGILHCRVVCVSCFQSCIPSAGAWGRVQAASPMLAEMSAYSGEPRLVKRSSRAVQSCLSRSCLVLSEWPGAGSWFHPCLYKYGQMHRHRHSNYKEYCLA